MIKTSNIHSLSDFQRKAKSHIRLLHRSGEPAVLTVNGKAEVVVQSAKAYQRLLDHVDRMESEEAVGRAIESANRGEGRPWREAMAEIKRRARRRRAA